VYPIECHKNAVLQWSGGKDSTAALLFCRPWWDKINVLWVNTGAAFPEVVDLAARVKEMVPRFFEVRTNQPAQTAAMGYPADIVSARSTALGKLLEPESVRPKLQLHWDCCASNIWFPMAAMTKKIGATLVIRGQKRSDKIRPPIDTGYIDEDGIEYWLPIRDFSGEDSLNYIRENGPDWLLPHYGPGSMTGLDCWDCSAYVFENFGRYKWMQKTHPEKWVHLRNRLAVVLKEARSEVEMLRQGVTTRPDPPPKENEE
jgi:3'-phosphoadenosine 5'-phosphosulfate sulfotransferase (PAPS reductase)/FAD synthetase